MPFAMQYLRELEELDQAALPESSKSGTEQSTEANDSTDAQLGESKRCEEAQMSRSPCQIREQTPQQELWEAPSGKLTTKA